MRCRRCGTDFPPDIASWMRFCGACGATLNAGSEVGPPTGELRFATILFADLAGFTEFAEERPPDEVARVVGDFLHRLGEAIERHGGSVDKFIGDAVMATYGLERPDASAARNAVRTGLAMQDAAREFRQRHGLPLELRVGIHAGEVMFGRVAGSRTVMGDTVNTAARIQSVATPGKVWISRPVYQKVRRSFVTVPQATIELKGKRRLVQPFEVQGERTHLLVDVPRFVGRAREWETLERAAADAAERHALRVVVIRGPAGCGKSRMVWELRERFEALAGSRLDVIQYDRSERMPAHGLAALLRARFDLRADLDEDQLWSLLSGGFRHEHPFVESVDVARELFAFILGVIRDDFRIHALDARDKWEGAFAELRRWMQGWAGHGPWGIVFEDAQKGDPETAAFVDWAIGASWNAAPLFVVTLRDEDFAPDSPWAGVLQRWRGDERLVELRLGELPRAELAEALRSMEPGLAEGLALRLAEHAEGNPLFATELLLLARDRGMLASPDAKLALPSSVREVMEARLERLGVAGREVAKRAALVGRRFSHDALARLWDGPATELSAGLDALLDSEAVYEETATGGGEPQLVFRNALLREAAVARIPREERERWMQRLEAWARERLAQHAVDGWDSAALLLLPIIAHAQEERGDAEGASLWLEALAQVYRRLHRTREAIDTFARAAVATSGTRRLVLLRRLAEELYVADAASRAVDVATSGRDVSEAPPPELPRELAGRLWSAGTSALDRWDRLTFAEAQLSLEMVRAELLAGTDTLIAYAAALEDLEQPLLAMEGDVARGLACRWAKATAHLFAELLGDPLGAEEICRRVAARLGPTLPDADRLVFLRAQEIAAQRSGDFARASQIVDEQLALAQRLRERREEVHAWTTKGQLHAARGQLGQALDAFQHALMVSRAIGYQRREAISHHNVGLIQQELGNYAAAQDHQEQYRAVSRTLGNRPGEAYGPAAQAACAIATGELDTAQRLLEAARAAADENGWARLMNWAQALEGERTLVEATARHDAEGVSRAAELLAGALQAGDTGPLHWTEEFDPGEFAATLAVARAMTAGGEAAQALLRTVRARVPQAYAVSHAWLSAAEAIVTGDRRGAAVEWFRARGYARAVTLLERLGAGVAAAGVAGESRGAA